MPRIAQPPEDEIVEDSEPEREQQRIQKKLKKSMSKKKAVAQQEGSELPRGRTKQSRQPQDCEIIVISDDSDISINVKPRAQGDTSKIALRPLAEPEKAFPTESLAAEQEKELGWACASDRSSSQLPAATIDNDEGRAGSPVTLHLSGDSSGQRGTAEKIRKVPDFSRYAYTGSRASSISVISHPSVHQAPSAISREIPDLVNPVPSVKVPKAKLGPHLIAIPDKDLMRLRKCVSCELSWMSRKTAPQKMKHIQTCAKKNKLDSHTVTALVRAELEKVEEDEKKNAKVSVVNTDLITVTLLENAVQEVISKKKGRRPKVIESVKQLSDTRQNILERARLLLQSQPSSAVPVGDPVAGPSALMSPPPTQPFGESTLAHRYQSRVSPDPTQPLLYIPSPPKAANGFGESNLAKQFSVKAHYLDHSSSPVHIPSPLAQRNRGLDSAHLSPTPRRLDLHEGADLMLGLGGEYTDNPVSLSSFRHGSVNEADPSHRSMATLSPVNDILNVSLHQEWDTPRSLLPETSLGRSAESEEVMHLDSDVDQRFVFTDRERDDAILHYNPNVLHAHESFDNLSQSSSSSFSSFSSLDPTAPTLLSSPLITDDERKRKDKDKKTVSKKRERPPKTLSLHRASSSDSDTPTLGFATKHKKRIPKKAEDSAFTTTKSTKLKSVKLTDEELFARLREFIVQDTQLYLRILRYEPIHIDVFLKMAAGTGVSSRGLKPRVREFLDKQAIHFYGLAISKRRTRRRSRQS